VLPLVSRAVLHGFVEPRYSASATDGRYAYVTDAGRGEVVTVDPRRARIVERTVAGAPPVPGGSYNVTHGAGRVFTPSLDRGTLSVLDERGRLLSHPTLAKAAQYACCVGLNP
jgi:hypothetical protein